MKERDNMSRKERKTDTEMVVEASNGMVAVVDGSLVPTAQANGKEEESPYDRYRRLRIKRTARIEQYTKLLSNLGNRKTYPWTDEDKEVTLDFMRKQYEIVARSLADTRVAKAQLGI